MGAQFCINIHYLCIYMQYDEYLYILYYGCSLFACVTSVIYVNKAFSAYFISWMYSYSTFALNAFCVRTQIA